MEFLEFFAKIFSQYHPFKMKRRSVRSVRCLHRLNEFFYTSREILENFRKKNRMGINYSEMKEKWRENWEALISCCCYIAGCFYKWWIHPVARQLTAKGVSHEMLFIMKLLQHEVDQISKSVHSSMLRFFSFFNPIPRAQSHQIYFELFFKLCKNSTDFLCILV